MGQKLTHLFCIITLLLAISCRSQQPRGGGGDGPGGGGGPQAGGPRRCKDCGRLVDENGDVINERDRRNQQQEQDSSNAPNPGNLGQNNGNLPNNGGQGSFQEGLGGNGQPGGIVDPTHDAAPGLNNPGTVAPTQRPGGGRTIASNEPVQDGEFLEGFVNRRGELDGTAREKLVREEGLRTRENRENAPEGTLVKRDGKFYLETPTDVLHLNLPAGGEEKEKATSILDKFKDKKIAVFGNLSYIPDPNLKKQGGRANYTKDGPKFARNSEYNFEISGIEPLEKPTFK